MQQNVSLLEMDKKRMRGSMPLFQIYFRKQQSHKGLLKLFYKICFSVSKFFYHVEIGSSTEIGGGLYIGHPFCITINQKAKIGENCNIHRGVLIGQENRGERKGCPTIGNCVWIGANVCIVGNITIGDDVLIAPNSFVNRNIPSHSIVFGNPCIVKHRDEATSDYVNSRV